MSIKTSELTKLIAEQVTKEVTRDVTKKLIPKLRRVVREEFDRGMKDMVYEMVVNQRPLQDNTLQAEQANFQEQPANISSAKNFIAQRQASKAKAQQILEKSFASDDPFANLIMNAEDPQEEIQMKQERMLSAPMKKITEVSGNDQTMPENIDYGSALDKLGI